MVLYYQSIFEVSFQERFKHTGVLSNCDVTQCQTILKVINKAKNNTDQNQQLWGNSYTMLLSFTWQKKHTGKCVKVVLFVLFCGLFAVTCCFETHGNGATFIMF